MTDFRHPLTLLCHSLLTILLLATTAHAQAAEEKPLELNGGGASFAAPLYLRWFRDYYLAHPKVQVDYQSTSTSGGVKDLIGNRLDFVGSDLRLTDQEAGKVSGGVIQVPMAGGGIVAVYHLDGVPELKLSRDALAGIASGRVARWNDPALAATNPDVALPDLPIIVVARSDSSGTTYKFTRYLSAISPEFAEEIGTTMAPNWPKALKQRGGLVRGRGNSGVAAIVQAIPGSIGYVQYAFAFLPGISMAVLENRSGKFIAPGETGFFAALDSISKNRSLENATDPAGQDAYPMIGLTWLLLHKEYDDPAKLAALKGVIGYAMGPGQAVTARLGYIPFPPQLIEYVQDQLK